MGRETIFNKIDNVKAVLNWAAFFIYGNFYICRIIAYNNIIATILVLLYIFINIFVLT